MLRGSHHGPAEMSNHRRFRSSRIQVSQTAGLKELNRRWRRSLPIWGDRNQWREQIKQLYWSRGWLRIQSGNGAEDQRWFRERSRRSHRREVCAKPSCKACRL